LQEETTSPDALSI